MQMTFSNNVRKVGRLVLSRTSCCWFFSYTHSSQFPFELHVSAQCGHHQIQIHVRSHCTGTIKYLFLDSVTINNKIKDVFFENLLKQHSLVSLGVFWAVCLVVYRSMMNRSLWPRSCVVTACGIVSRYVSQKRWYLPISLHSAAANEVGDGPGPRECICTCIGNAFSPYTVAVFCLILVLLSDIDNNEEGVQKVFDKSLWRLNDNFGNSFHKILLLTVDWSNTVLSHYHSFT
jgi:hypothetical protein